MLALLLASVGAAYALVYFRTILPDRRGREILKQMRSRGLRHYWPEEGKVSVALASSGGGQRIAWARARVEDRFVGTIRRGSDEERWRLADDLSSGRYEGAAAVGRVGGFPVVDKTLIDLESGRVTVVHGDTRAVSAAPDNYIPEGTMTLVARLVAEGGQAAAFRTVFNADAFAGSEVNFTRIVMSPRGPRRVQLKASLKTGVLDEEWEFDEGGRPAAVTITDPRGQSVTLVRVEDRGGEQP